MRVKEETDPKRYYRDYLAKKKMCIRDRDTDNKDDSIREATKKMLNNLKGE